MPNPFAENFGMLVNSRAVQVLDRRFRPEESWNYGASLTNDLTVLGNVGSFVLDFYRTNFRNQLIVDMESSEYVRFYNLRGQSYSNSFQAELNLQPVKRLELKAAYRWFDVQQSVLAAGGEAQDLDPGHAAHAGSRSSLATGYFLTWATRRSLRSGRLISPGNGTVADVFRTLQRDTSTAPPRRPCSPRRFRPSTRR